MFAAQAIARDMVAAGREDEIAEIRDFISMIVPDPEPSDRRASKHPGASTTDA